MDDSVCLRHISLYRPPRDNNSVWLPRSTMRPWCRTIIWSELTIVERRCLCARTCQLSVPPSATGKNVRDSDRGTPLADLRERRLNDLLRLRVQRRRRLVHQHDIGILQDRPGNRDLQRHQHLSPWRRAGRLTRCFSPPDSRSPRSPTRVSYPSGNDRMRSWMLAKRQAAYTSSSEAAGRE